MSSVRSPIDRKRKNSAGDEARVIVSNLPLNTKWTELKTLFRNEIGEVAFAKVYNDELGRQNGLVEFSSMEAARRAIKQMDNFDWKGKLLTVREVADGKTSETKEGRDGGGGGRPSKLSRSGTGSRRVFVSKLPHEMKWQEVKTLFREQVGNVEFVELFNDENGKPRGCGIVEFDSDATADKAIKKMNKFEVMQRKISVREAFDVERDKFGFIVNSSGGGSGGGGPRVVAPSHRTTMPRPSKVSSNLGNTFGLSAMFLESLGIDGPLHTNIYIGNLRYDVEERKLREVFRMSGKIISVELNKDKDGKSRGFALLQYSHPVEAVQAISMFNNQMLYDRSMIVRLDKIPPREEELPNHLPDGLSGLGMGLGDGGKPLANVVKNISQNTNNSGGTDIVTASAKTLAELTPALAILAQQLKLNIGQATNQTLGFNVQGSGQFPEHSRYSDGVSNQRAKGISDYDTLVVHNLPSDLNWQMLSGAFQTCGEIKNCFIKEPGVGIIRFADPRSAARAFDYHNTLKWGRIIDVSYF